MGSNDEPSNPFKNPRKSTSNTKNSAPKTTRRPTNRSSSVPPAPPGTSKKNPPVAPSGGKSKSNKPKDSGAPARAGKSVGLRKQVGKARTEAQKKTDAKAKELIEASRAKVIESTKDRPKPVAQKQEPNNPFKKNQTQRPKGGTQQRRGGRPGKRNKPQGPTKRVQKLHRGKYMEFKYDVRRILEEEEVEDEHRSNVLGQTWAKGERSGVSDAKEFLQGKVADGIISEVCSKRIIKLIDSLTTRR